MATNTDADKPSTIWTPLYRADLEALLDRQEYTTLHLSVLSWLIWLSLLSGDEMLRVLARATESQRVTTKADLSAQIRSMKNLGLIDAITLREPALNRHQRYYATDMGLYLYLSAVNPSPPISMARLAQSYPIERDDLLARLARPHLHLALTTLATHLIADGSLTITLSATNNPGITSSPLPTSGTCSLLMPPCSFNTQQARLMPSWPMWTPALTRKQNARWNNCCSRC